MAVHRTSKQREILDRVLEAGTIMMMRRNCYGKWVNAMQEARQNNMHVYVFKLINNSSTYLKGNVLKSDIYCSYVRQVEGL